MAEGRSLKEKKELLLQNTFLKIDKVYSRGLYSFIEEKPAYSEEMDKLEERIHHLVVSGACDAIVESGKSKIFKGYYFFLCDNDMFYRLLTGEQIWSELRQSNKDE